jgi:hypothetical protein
MADGRSSRERYGEAFWRAHHEAWRQGELNQREYCEARGVSLKAFGNWRAKFKAEPQPPTRKLLYRRGGLSHRLSRTLSHRLSHMTNGSPEPTRPHRRRAPQRAEYPITAADRGDEALARDAAWSYSWPRWPRRRHPLHPFPLAGALSFPGRRPYRARQQFR